MLRMDGISESTRRRVWIAVTVLIGLFVVIAVAAILERFGFTIQAFVYALVIALLGLASLCDLRKHMIPNVLVVSLIALWVATVWFIPCGTEPGSIGAAFADVTGSAMTAVVLDGFAGGLAVGGGMLLLTLLFEARTGHHSFGGGDIKLLFAVSLFLGLPAALTMLLIACVALVLLALLVRLISPYGWAGSEVEEPFVRLALPFAPSIALATGLCFALGPLSLF